MTNMSLNLNKNYPFLLEPCGKDYLWGGDRLKKEFNKKIDVTPLAETWECSTHPDGMSIVASGKYKGYTLKQVLKENPKYVGTHPQNKEELPILIKFIDAKKDLSVQVHPSDEYAKEYENGQLGKTEMWYVLDANEDSKIIYGFNSDVDKEIIKSAIDNESINKYLNKIPIKKDDVFYIESGTIHAIGEGALIAEIQENSNLTYRLYDYKRKDKNGNTRELHIDKALDVINYKRKDNLEQHMRIRKYKKGYLREFLCRCKYFEVYRERINSNAISFKTNTNSFHVLLILNGTGKLTYDNNELKIEKGNCIFVPADSIEFIVEGNIELLNVNC